MSHFNVCAVMFQASLAAMQARGDGLEKDLNATKEELSSTKESLKATETVKNELNAKLKKSSIAATMRRAALKTQLQDTGESLEAQSEAFIQLKAAYEELEAALDLMTFQKDQAEKHGADLTEQLAAMTARAEASEAAHRQTQSELAAVEEELRKTKDEFKTFADNATRHIASLESQQRDTKKGAGLQQLRLTMEKHIFGQVHHKFHIWKHRTHADAFAEVKGRIEMTHSNELAALRKSTTEELNATLEAARSLKQKNEAKMLRLTRDVHQLQTQVVAFSPTVAKPFTRKMAIDDCHF